MTEHGVKDLGDFLRFGVEDIETVSKDADDHRGGFAADGFTDSIAQEGHHPG